MKKLLVVLALVALPGCASWQKKVQPVLSEAAAFIADAQDAVSIVRSFVNIWFLSNPNPPAQVKIEHAIQHVSKAINVAVRATNGADSLTREELDAAWVQFRAAYSELEALLQDAGILGSGRMGAARGGSELPEPLALRGRR